MSERDTESTDHENDDMLESASPTVGADHATAVYDSLYLPQRGFGEPQLTFPSEEPMAPGRDVEAGSNWLQVLSGEGSSLSSNNLACDEAYPPPHDSDCIRSLATGVNRNLASSEMHLPSHEDLRLFPSNPGPSTSPRDKGFALPSTYVGSSNPFPEKETGLYPHTSGPSGLAHPMSVQRIPDELADAIVTLQRQKDQLCTHAQQRLEATMSLYDFGVLFGILSPHTELRQLLKDAYAEFCTLQSAPTPPRGGPVVD
ncbi:hypothetical protein ASPCADRAFT_126457 [Aspergillus carbonarius ITEM 5010]|uniref:Uncharacterized protein n=1 Tax=Aspergillus carbonarius (strain ITEM 5010) TaxID=602072 RepID=A0A1R3RYG5_ASPC5|nr:hypothetical protein ASPCADRAFT_126457 [Aspergillus carbonarius ITEM 5010]